MADENGNGGAEESPAPLSPIKRCVQVHAHLQADLAWWLFAIGSYCSKPTPAALTAMIQAAADAEESATLVTQATKDLINFVAEALREAEGDE